MLQVCVESEQREEAEYFSWIHSQELHSST